MKPNNEYLERAREVISTAGVRDNSIAITAIKYIFPELNTGNTEDATESRNHKDDREFPVIAKVKDTGKLVIINGSLITDDGSNEYYSNDGYYFYKPDEIVFYDECEDDSEKKKWTLDDAKPGDVLAGYAPDCDNPLIFILKDFKHIKYNLVRESDYHSFCYLKANERQQFCTGRWHHIHDLKPATAKQQKLLFIKMKEAGYVFDFEKKDLKKLNHKFNVGDEVKTGNEESLTITKIDEKGYWSGELFICDFDDSAAWDIVETANKVEPKFKIGDWIVFNKEGSYREIMYIYDIKDNRYYLNNDMHFSWGVQDCDKKCHIWSIKDAIAGDVLASTGSLFIYKEEYMAGKPTAYCGLIDGIFLVSNSGCWTNERCYPATDEQKELLLSKIKKAGWSWNPKTLELSKNEQ